MIKDVLTLNNDIFLNKRLAWLVATITVIIFIISLLEIILSWLPQEIPTIPVPVVETHQQVSPNQIPTWHLLGENPSTNLPETNLQLTLQGVLAMPDAGRASAIVAGPDGHGKVYRVGESLPGGATLYKVLPNAIVIRYRGSLEKLPLVRPTLHFTPVPQQSTLFQ